MSKHSNLIHILYFLSFLFYFFFYFFYLFFIYLFIFIFFFFYCFVFYFCLSAFMLACVFFFWKAESYTYTHMRIYASNCLHGHIVWLICFHFFPFFCFFLFVLFCFWAVGPLKCAKKKIEVSKQKKIFLRKTFVFVYEI